MHPLVGPHLDVHGPQKALLDCGVGIRYVKQVPGCDTTVGSVTELEKNVVMTVVITTLPLVTKLVVNGAASQESRVPGQVDAESLVGKGLGMTIGRAASVSCGDAAVRDLVGKGEL